ncbi:MAG TPA: glycosyltransferase family 2 protein [Pseudacidobacterium sp.]|nr:glycosyltransferase family 2 protein [Pseudacidobacterium sp.]
MKSGMELSIIIVNWKSADYLRKCLKSVYAGISSLRCEIIVIDNASGDGCGEMLALEFPDVIFIASHKNLGFAGANNLAFERSVGRYVLFLNPDTELLPGALRELMDALDASPAAALIGAQLLNSDLSLQDSCIQRFPTILNQLLDFEFLRKKLPPSDFFATRPFHGQQNSIAEVDCVSGACMLVKRELFSAVGMFSTRYFMYSEDVDLCYKIKLAGGKVYYAPRARVVHHGGRSSTLEPQSHFATVVMRESRWRFMTAWYGSAYAVAYRMTTAFGAVARIAMLGAAIAITRNRERRLRFSGAVQKWAKVLRWSLGMESWAKQLEVKVQGA